MVIDRVCLDPMTIRWAPATVTAVLPAVSVIGPIPGLLVILLCIDSSLWIRLLIAVDKAFARHDISFPTSNTRSFARLLPFTHLNHLRRIFTNAFPVPSIPQGCTRLDRLPCGGRFAHHRSSSWTNRSFFRDMHFFTCRSTLLRFRCQEGTRVYSTRDRYASESLYLYRGGRDAP